MSLSSPEQFSHIPQEGTTESAAARTPGPPQNFDRFPILIDSSRYRRAVELLVRQF